ncbi:MAG: hypothetical protein IJW81_00755 [Clostridia bacterium]|nr:hypothetical protein [Clostridia bacterium]
MQKNFTFDGSISREVLNNYLSRAVTHFGIGYDNTLFSDTFEDDLRMLKNEGAKFIGRAALVWHCSVPDEKDLPLPRNESPEAMKSIRNLFFRPVYLNAFINRS